MAGVSLDEKSCTILVRPIPALIEQEGVFVQLVFIFVHVVVFDPLVDSSVTMELRHIF